MTENIGWKRRRAKRLYEKMKEATEARRAAGGHLTRGRVLPDELDQRRAEIPPGPHTVTGMLMGDPPPVDMRRAGWAPHLAGGK